MSFGSSAALSGFSAQPPGDADGIPEVLQQWPGPIAHVYKRTLDDLLRAKTDAFAATSAMMILKDLIEVMIMLPCVVMVRDLATASPESAAVAAFRGLFVGKPLSLGDWCDSADKLATEISSSTVTGLLAPQVAQLFRKSQPIGKPKESDLARILRELIKWRNDTIGHGPHRVDQADILRDVESTFGKLNKAIRQATELKPWEGIVLRGRGSEAALVGHESMCSHREFPASVATPHVRPEHESLELARGQRTLALAPYASIRRCPICAKRDVFLFSSRKPGDVPKYYFFEYVAGHTAKDDRRDKDVTEWTAEVQAAKRAKTPEPDTVSSVRDEFISLEIFDQLAGSIRVEDEYVPPDYLHSWVNAFERTNAKGILCLRAPAHSGKSVFSQQKELLKAIKADWNDPYVCTMHIRRDFNFGEARWNDFIERKVIEETFGVRLARDPLPWISNPDEDPAVSLVSLLRKLDSRRRGRRVLLCLDGLDELPEPGEERRSIVDFIPPAHELPEGFYLLLTCRPERETPTFVQQRLKAVLKGPDGGDADHVSTLEGGPCNPGYQAVLRKYFDKLLKGMLKEMPSSVRDQLFSQILDRSDGTFLYFAHLVGLLETGMIAPADLAIVGRVPALFKAYLDRLGRLIGERQMDLVERVLSVLAAVEEAHDEDVRIQPAVCAEPEWHGVSMDLLGDLLDELWTDTGGPGSLRLLFALQSIRSVLRSWQTDGSDTSRYRLGLKGFVQSMREEPKWSDRIDATHRRLAETFMLQWGGRYGEITPSEPDAEYLLRNVVLHAQACRTRGVVEQLLVDATLLDDLKWRVAESLDAGSRRDAVRWISLLVTTLAQGESTVDSETRDSLAGCYNNRGRLRSDLGDHDGAREDYDRAIQIREALIEAFGEECPADWRDGLANSYHNRGNLRSELSDHDLANEDYDRAIQIREALIEAFGEECPADWRDGLTNSYSNRGLLRSELGDHDGAREDHDRAIEIQEALVEEQGEECSPDHCDSLAASYNNRGNLRSELGDHDGAREDYDCAIEVREALIEAIGEHCPADWHNGLALSYSNRGLLRSELDDHDGAREDHDRAIQILEALSETLGEECPARWLGRLANSYNNRGLPRSESGDKDGAREDYDRAIQIQEALIEPLGEECPPDWRDGLAGSYNNRGNLRSELGDHDGAREDYDRAIQIKEALIESLGEECPPRWLDRLANSYNNRGLLRLELGDHEGACEDYDRAIQIQEALIESLGEECPPDLHYQLADLISDRAAFYDNLEMPARACEDCRKALVVLDACRQNINPSVPLADEIKTLEQSLKARLDRLSSA